MHKQNTSTPPRIAFYSHDTMGLGHIRRNMLLAQSVLEAYPDAEVLLISGVRESGAFKLPKGADSVTLPTYFKTSEGSYLPRSLGQDIKRLVNIRKNIIHAALESFEPDILVVDNVPRGAMNELDNILPELSSRGTHIVLGVRDIIDEPEVVQRQWKKLQNIEIIRLYFSSIWVYGDPNLYNFADEYHVAPDIVKKLRYVGYLDQSRRMEVQGLSTISEIDPPYALCAVGGGQDGFDLAHAFMQSELPEGWRGILIAGALMPEGQRAKLHEMGKQRARNNIRVVDFVPEPLKIMQNAECIISMGGYNTTTEILSFNKRALIVPRIKPRTEQWIRASRLAEMGIVECLHPDQLSPQALEAFMQSQKVMSDARNTLRFDGLNRVVCEVRSILGQA